jgi:acetylornithine/N-succinyldiaminopimelate aminotransferase
MIDEELVAREAAVVMPTYARQPIEVVRGEGASLYDRAGRRYVDCMSGISQSNVGHCHPDVVAAIREQAGTLINASNLYYTEPMVALAEWISQASLGGKVFFCNSGAEASEAALKLARRARPGRSEIVALTDGFHGRTMGSLSLTGQAAKQEPFAPLVPGVRHVDRADVEGLGAAVSERTAAIFVEIVQGECGVHPVPEAMLVRARELADEVGAVLIVDEIQTGLSRTGPLFAYQESPIAPDVMCLAKSLGGGVPIGAIVATPELSDSFSPGDHGSTFAAGPLACAAALAACGVLERPELQERVRQLGAAMLDRLEVLVGKGLASEARGRGLMLAIDLPRARGAELVEALLFAGYLANATGPRTVRFLPPLVISSEDLAALADTLEEVIPTVLA